MTNFEKITNMNVEELAKFLCLFDFNEIPRLYACNEVYCENCKDNFTCSVNWLNMEAKK